MVTRPGWLTRPVLAWALYDVASSTFAALVPIFFGLFFVTVVAADRTGAQAQWGAIASLALVLAGMLAPFYGAWADRRARTVVMLAAATAVCVIATVAMPLAGHGKPMLAAALFILAQVGYTLAAALYDSLLVWIAPRTHVGRVSGFGWTLGFAGGIVALLAALGVMHGQPDDMQAARLTDAFLIAGLLFAAFALPALLGLRRFRGDASDRRAPGSAAPAAYTSVIDTLRHWREHREIFRFLVGYYLLNDVLVTVLFFIVIVLRTRFGFGITGLLWLAMLYHIVALPATLAFGHAADRWGYRPTIQTMAAVLGGGVLLLAFGTGTVAAVIVVVLLGLVYGSLQAVCRSLLVLLTPARKAAQIFGFNAVAGRLSAALGPLVFGIVASASGSQTAAVLSLLPFLIAGAAVLGTVRVSAPPMSSEAAAGEVG